MNLNVSTVVGFHYQDDQVALEVVRRTFSQDIFLGSLVLTGVARKDPVMTQLEVKAFFEKLKISPESVFVTISPDQVAFRNVILPPEAAENLDQAVELQLLNMIPSEPADFCVERVVRQLPNQSFSVDLYIVPKEKIVKITEFIKSIGLTVEAVTLSAFSIEHLLGLRGKSPCRFTFVADLDYNNFSLYLFQESCFSSFKLTWINPMDKNIDQVLKEIERLASLNRVTESDEIEVFVNLSDSNWADKIQPQDHGYIRRLTECSPFPNWNGNDVKGLAAACLALNPKGPDVNLLPPTLRPKPVRWPKLLLAALLALLWVGILMNVTLNEYEVLEFRSALKAKSMEMDKEFGRVTALRKKVAAEEKKLASYQFLLKRPISDLRILKDLSEKVDTNTYLFDYVRTESLIIAGYSDSVLKLQSANSLAAIKYFKKFSMEGSINKVRVPLNPKAGRGGTFKEMETFRMNIQLGE